MLHRYNSIAQKPVFVTFPLLRRVEILTKSFLCSHDLSRARSDRRAARQGTRWPRCHHLLLMLGPDSSPDNCRRDTFANEGSRVVEKPDLSQALSVPHVSVVKVTPADLDLSRHRSDSFEMGASECKYGGDE